MNREEFKRLLAEKLAALSDDERNEVFSFFDECLDEALENGENESEALGRLGSPDEVAEQLLADGGAQSYRQEQTNTPVSVFDPAELIGIRV